MSDTQSPETLTSAGKLPITGQATGTTSARIVNPTNYIRFNSKGVAYGVGFTPDGTLPADALACSQEQYQNWQSWSNVGGVLTETTPPTLTLPQQAFALLAGGLTITLTGSLTGTVVFATTPQAMSNWQKLATVVAQTGTFPGGATSWDMQDTSGAWHPYTLAQWKTISAALAAFDAQCLLVMAQHPSATLPSSTITLEV